MDSLIARFDAVKDADLMLCEPRGVAYQRDFSKRQPAGVSAEGDNYFDHYAALDGSEIGRRLHEERVAFVYRHIGEEHAVLDVGVGSGEFIRSRPNTIGFDVNPKALAWLADAGKLAGDIREFDAFTFWDVLEHVPEPHPSYFKRMRPGSWLFTSLPIFGDVKRIRESRHYKPGEHLYYWTEQGFIDWMAAYQFRLVETSTVETDIGRDSIVSFAFCRDLPGYHETVDQYREIHARAYGTSAWLHFDQVAHEVMNLRPGSIIDWGCGRSDLVAHFWLDGRRRIAKYDPAIPQFKELPEGIFDLALCCDVLEHIPITDLDRVLGDIKAKARNAVFTISTRLARAKLPDGRNAHVTLLTPSEWTR
jgi:2-polyprenyl-3-methyl-5-hydroxy-6-metoxy-1,4-benzoquinol methylase